MSTSSSQNGSPTRERELEQRRQWVEACQRQGISEERAMDLGLIPDT
ncbi:hypothetical protein ACFQYP_06230 [Nonomuraea antimicrobica]